MQAILATLDNESDDIKDAATLLLLRMSIDAPKGEPNAAANREAIIANGGPEKLVAQLGQCGEDKERLMYTTVGCLGCIAAGGGVQASATHTHTHNAAQPVTPAFWFARTVAGSVVCSASSCAMYVPLSVAVTCAEALTAAGAVRAIIDCLSGVGSSVVTVKQECASAIANITRVNPVACETVMDCGGMR